MNRLAILSLKLADRELSDQEASELLSLVESANAQRDLVSILRVEGLLHAASHDSKAEDVVNRLGEERLQRIESQVMRSVASSQALTTSPSSRPTRRRGTSFVVFIGIGLAALVAFVLLSFAIRTNKVAQARIATLRGPASGVLLRTRNSTNWKSAGLQSMPISLQAGHQIMTIGAFDAAEIEFEDGSRIDLLGKSRVELDHGPENAHKLQVFEGSIQADVAPQIVGSPFQIHTGTAQLSILGTSLSVDVGNASTQLQVSSGLVAMTRTIDGKSVRVPEGRLARATLSTHDSMQPTPLPMIPDTWSLDLSNGLPSGWQAGELIANSGFATVRATPESSATDANIAVTTHNAWREGQHALFRMQDDTLLNLRIRQKDFARIRVMVVTRVFPPQQGRFGANLFYTRRSWNKDLPPDTWRTISIPLSQFDWYTQRNEQGMKPLNLKGLAAYMIQITTNSNDVDLAIDRMWVTREEYTSQTAHSDND